MQMIMAKVELRFQKVSDAKRFYKILNNPNFIYFSAKPKSIEDEKKWIKASYRKRRGNTEHHYTILYGGKVVGGCGIRIDRNRDHIGEMGYFVDEAYWGRGIAAKAVRILERIGFGKLKLRRIAILMNSKNSRSERVATKSGYRREALLRKTIKRKDGKYDNTFIYAKVK